MLFLWIGLRICAGFALLTLFVWCNNSWLKTTGYTVKVQGLKSKVRIVQLSDLHGKSFGRNNARLIKRVVKADPDFIAVTGDIIHKYTKRNKRVALKLVNGLSKVAPVVFVSGNHEMRALEYRTFRAELSAAGALVLDDCTADICGLTVVGLNCASQKNDTVGKITPKEIPEGSAKVLLAHKPQFIDKYAEFGYDLILSGHAHGGQWRIPFTGIGLYAPGQGKFPKFTSGVHTRGKTKMVISRGLGNSQFPLRLFNRPEVVIINLEPQTDPSLALRMTGEGNK